ncbi:hypothetical protein [Novosphingobium sp. CECT 9465]|uniref:hypothetical protein n=1 Tax=Novosphingobium sp. CECT 9465 TaxID=2829794 RepID=UPI001E5A70AB|nr:hypothetical protein [Novosphingobium sp. CECT 9465]CAH0496128.1 hypothetical protein NVSP9465_01158 [Novosphingobium sp. CECT 9465]
MIENEAPQDPVTPHNPVTAARLQVEAVIPPEKRGPGWDRHWRELEHYAEAAMDWTVSQRP